MCTSGYVTFMGNGVESFGSVGRTLVSLKLNEIK